ncbi:(Fe-S)-binding protein [candidate division KSB1 bacterium]
MSKTENKKMFDYDSLFDCIHCGLCLTKCPTYVVTGSEADSPRGRLFLMRSVEDGRIDVNSSFIKHIDLCLACRACETSCPSGVIYHPLHENSQKLIAEKTGSSFLIRILKKIILVNTFPNPGLLKVLFGLLKIYQISGLQNFVRGTRFLKLFSRNLYNAELSLPKIAGNKLLNINDLEKGEVRQKKVLGFLRGCVMDYFYPGTNINTIKILTNLGFKIVIPEEQHCCGAVHLHNKEFELAKVQARNTIDAFEKAEVDYVISNAAGCGTMMKEYGDLLKDDKEYSTKATAFSRKVKDISEFLAEHISLLEFVEVNRDIVFDDPCHLLHGQKISREPRQLLEAIPGLNILPLKENDMCCGSAGTYNLAQPEMSQRILNRKMENIKKAKASSIVTANIGCMIQLKKGIEQNGEKIEVVHIVDILSESLFQNEPGNKK